MDGGVFRTLAELMLALSREDSIELMLHSTNKKAKRTVKRPTEPTEYRAAICSYSWLPSSIARCSASMAQLTFWLLHEAVTTACMTETSVCVRVCVDITLRVGYPLIRTEHVKRTLLRSPRNPSDPPLQAVVLCRRRRRL